MPLSHNTSPIPVPNLPTRPHQSHSHTHHLRHCCHRRRRPLSRPLEHCEGRPAPAGVRNLGLDDPTKGRPDSHCNFDDRSIRACRPGRTGGTVRHARHRRAPVSVETLLCRAATRRTAPKCQQLARRQCAGHELDSRTDLHPGLRTALCRRGAAARTSLCASPTPAASSTWPS
jgi:hypothetical protein